MASLGAGGDDVVVDGRDDLGSQVKSGCDGSRVTGLSGTRSYGSMWYSNSTKR